MNKIFAASILIIIILSSFLRAEINFDEYFLDKTLRIDYYHTGHAEQEIFSLDMIYEYGVWAGNPCKLLDQFGYGKYYAKVFDAESGKLIFSRGYDTYFGEYQTTGPAHNKISRTYHETVLIPRPLNTARFIIEKRNKQGIFQKKYELTIDPNDYHILKEKPAAAGHVIEALNNGPAHDKVDIAFLAEGYAADEIYQFKHDLKKHSELLFTFEPFASSRDKFNIYGVFVPSADSGIDEPRKGIYKNTTLNSSFNALDLDRYLLTEDNRTLRSIAAQVPYDAIFIMVNSERYGGGGIYNFYAVFTAHSPAVETVFVHEFGHSFAGLADEYYNASTAYNEFYPKGVEPAEPNITALLDPKNLKWDNEVYPGTAKPAEWNKFHFDNLDIKRQELRAEYWRLKESNLDPGRLAEVRKEMNLISQKLNAFIKEHPLKDKAGFFEGAGYASEGLYRPMLNCIMISNREKKFCKVCQKAIQKMIDFHSAK